MSTALSGATSVSAKSIKRSAITSLGACEMATEEMAIALPDLIDDSDVGVEKNHVVSRDGEADLKFLGTLLASAGPEARYGKDRWREYRIYCTKGGNYIFTKVGRSVVPGERDKWEASVWKKDSPSNVWSDGKWVPKKWPQEAADFFGFDDMAKRLYRKLSVDTAESVE